MASHRAHDRLRTALAVLACTALLAACSKTAAPPTAGDATVHPAVTQANAAVAKAADLSDPASFADAKRGFVAAPSGQVKDEAGNVVWDFAAFAFVQGAAPATVNPSLWRQALLNNQTGLFQVNERIWQLRGFDIANLTLIRGRNSSTSGAMNSMLISLSPHLMPRAKHLPS